MDLVADTRRIAYGSMSDQLNFLDGDHPLGAAELKMVMDLNAIQPGMVLSAGLNVYYVIGVDAGKKLVTVYPSYQNSLNEALPAGTPVMIRPRVTDWVIFQNLNDAIRKMSSNTYGLYRLGVETVAWSPLNWNIYPLVSTNVQSIVAVNYREDWWNGDWKRLPDKAWRWESKENAIRLLDRYGDTYPYNDGTPVNTHSWQNNLEVTFRSPFVTATALTDDVVVDLGLTPSMVDIPPLAAAETLVRTTESRRTQIHAQGDPRRADEVGVGANTNAARDLRRQFDQRCEDEYARLINANPWMQSR